MDISDACEKVIKSTELSKESINKNKLDIEFSNE